MADPEVERILREFERRSREIPADWYAAVAPAQLFMRQARERVALEMLGDAGFFPLADKKSLDVGCGSGQWLVDFETWGATRANLAGIDLVPARAAHAKARLAEVRNETGQILTAGADIRTGNATELPWPDAAFDLVAQSMMFSSILDDGMRAAVAREMVRVLAARGIVLWYDFFVDNPRNPHMRGVAKREVARLFPGFRLYARRVTLMPPLARRLLPRWRFVAGMLESIRLLNTAFVIILRRAAASPA
jgi:ubiquinone/menaquinone biosynthesis C-methylase UbiE